MSTNASDSQANELRHRATGQNHTDRAQDDADRSDEQDVNRRSTGETGNRLVVGPHNPTGSVNENDRLHADDEEFIDLLNENTFAWRTLLSSVLGVFALNREQVQFPAPATPAPPPPVSQAAQAEDLNNTTHGQLYRVRQRLFRTIFTKIALMFVVLIPPKVRKLIEYSLLISAIGSLFMLAYLHVVFVRRPRNCLESIQNDWPTDGILRLEILDDTEQHSYIANINEPLLQKLDENQAKSSNLHTSSLLNGTILNQTTSEELAESTLTEYGDSNDELAHERHKEKPTHLQMLSKAMFSNGNYAVEYSLEHGFLRLTTKTRQKLNIPTKTVYLNPSEEKCFGDWFSRVLLKYFFGYNDILMNSLKYLAEKQNNKGYVRNVVTGEHYRFVNIWMTRTSYIAAAFIMLIFTLTISMLLRYSHHQVFVFVAQLTQMLEFNSPVSFPVAPILTVVLALIGMEAIMTEFFNDSTTAFNIILIVWSADQYDWICCHTSVTRRNWLKFFYLYHFAFYAYVYRFNGQYAGLALLTSWLFILHSMMYFFHHYELPFIISQSARLQQNPDGTIDAGRAVPTLTIRILRPNEHGQLLEEGGQEMIASLRIGNDGSVAQVLTARPPQA